MSSEPARPPEGTGPGGRALWRAVIANGGRALVLDPAELELLRQAARTRDLVDALERELARTGLVVEGSKGQPVVSRLPAELARQRALLARLLGGIEVPDAAAGSSSSSPGTPRSEGARRAAFGRWRAEDERRARHGLPPRPGLERRTAAAEAAADPLEE